MKQFLFFLSTFFAINIFAQTIPPIEWQKCIGGTSEDYLYKTSPTSDGGSITVGWGGSADGDAADHHGGYDFLAAKLDAAGNKIWSRCYGGNNGDIGNGIQQTADGGYIMCGSTNSKNNGDVIGLHGDGFWADGWLVKLDAAGNITWQKCLGGTNGETLIVVQQTPDGGYIAAGSSSSTDGDASTNYGSADAWIVKLTASGTIVWQRSYGGSKEDLVTNILQLADGNYIFSARSKSGDYNLPGNYGKNDVWF